MSFAKMVASELVGASFTIASRGRVDQFAPEVEELLMVLLGSTEALVTDESRVTDFLSMDGTEDEPALAALAHVMGRVVQQREFLGELAQELRSRKAG